MASGGEEDGLSMKELSRALKEIAEGLKDPDKAPDILKVCSESELPLFNRLVKQMAGVTKDTKDIDKIMKVKKVTKVPEKDMVPILALKSATNFQMNSEREDTIILKDIGDLTTMNNIDDFKSAHKIILATERNAESFLLHVQARRGQLYFVMKEYANKNGLPLEKMWTAVKTPKTTFYRYIKFYNEFVSIRP